MQKLSADSTLIILIGSTIVTQNLGRIQLNMSLDALYKSQQSFG